MAQIVNNLLELVDTQNEQIAALERDIRTNGENAEKRLARVLTEQNATLRALLVTVDISAEASKTFVDSPADRWN